MTPSFIGLMATMLPGVRPSMSLASLPTASTRPFTLLMATIDGSLTTIPLPRAYTQVLAVPRSMARSLEKTESIERRLKRISLREVVRVAAVLCSHTQVTTDSRVQTIDFLGVFFRSEGG